jgi:hypothetical protein
MDFEKFLRDILKKFQEGDSSKHCISGVFYGFFSISWTKMNLKKVKEQGFKGNLDFLSYIIKLNEICILNSYYLLYQNGEKYYWWE